MPNHLKFCSCRQCKAGRHSKAGKATVRATIRADRKAVKAALSKGDDPPRKAGVPYTD
jgi:hypothetical protein